MATGIFGALCLGCRHLLALVQRAFRAASGGALRTHDPLFDSLFAWLFEVALALATHLILLL